MRGRPRLEMLGFVEFWITNSTHISHQARESNRGHIGGRQVLSPLRHVCSPLNNNVGLKESHTLCSKLLYTNQSFDNCPNYERLQSSKTVEKFVLLLSRWNTSERNDHNSCCSQLGETSCSSSRTSTASRFIRSMVKLGSIPEIQ